ncbi:MAG TPA: four helix bundle protein [Lachnoclostridium phytofermentans]|uniref:Four helix bundle protein n=1 Tax=Lachnoclostridium phytofermentans TaxID=66219 RepID=A0A3D2X263_9FIRM|nr:four helix bundle protein [Lachnoclostridium phytofermentans]
MKEKNILLEKSTDFAVAIVELSKRISQNPINGIFINQVVRSSSSIMSNVAESEFASSRKDFLWKLQISLKEANETKYWLTLMKRSLFISQKDYDKLLPECEELIKMLVSSCNTIKKN